MPRGRFITIEGGEGAGKTTNAKFAARAIREHGHDVLATREPGGTPLAEEIRSVLISKRDEAVDPLTETLLIFAARAQHVATVIEPNLAAGRWVLCERFTDSTFAYQAGGRGLGRGVVQHLADLSHPDCWPDLTVYLDLPVESAMARIAGRGLDRFEQERTAFFQRVRDAYLREAAEHPRFVTIDASRDLPAVQRDIAVALERILHPS